MASWSVRLLLALSLVLTATACKKKEEAAQKTPAVADDAVVDEGPPPPPPPPKVADRNLDIDGWSLQFGVPEGFERVQDTQGEFRPAGPTGPTSVGITLGGVTPPYPASWLRQANDVLLQIIAGYDYVDVDGKRTPAKVVSNEKVAAGWYRYEVVVPAGGGVLGEESMAGGVVIFDDEWPGYVSCYWTTDYANAPTYRPALLDACERIAVKSAPARPAVEPPPTEPTDDPEGAEPPDRPAPERTPAPADDPAAEPVPAT